MSLPVASEGFPAEVVHLLSSVVILATVLLKWWRDRRLGKRRDEERRTWQVTVAEGISRAQAQATSANRKAAALLGRDTKEPLTSPGIPIPPKPGP